MSDADRPLTGPDFSLGVDANEIAEGALVAGHANGEAVVLARGRAGLFAIGASCTHYGGPLAEGLVVGDTVRCPWHHACYSLRTGEPVGAPARKDIACFEIAQREGKVYVLGKRPPRAARTSSGTGPASVLIIGAGAAGSAAAEALRGEGYAGPVTIVGADPAAPYDRPNLSKDYLAGNAPEEWIPLRGPEFYEEHRITLALGVAVDRIDLASKHVVLADGSSRGFGALLVATGADPVRLPIAGADRPHVHTLRTLADSRAIVARAQTAKRAVIIGAGFIGLEAAASLRARSVDVCVVAPEAVPLASVMGPQLGRAIQALHEAHGVSFRLGPSPVSIEDETVTLDTGEKLPTDLVVMGVGVRPATQLAQAAGLSIDRGIVVDAYLETSAKQVFAAGDVARFPDARSGQSIRVEHWVVAERQGRTAALNMLGHRERFDAVPFFWSAHYDVTISYVGHAESWDRIDVVGDIGAHDCALAYRRGDRTLAVATVGRDGVSLRAEAAMDRGDEAALLRLFSQR